mmetsp:Transcript_59113/g.70515  ORF Transcript_59113/g.70515 Transcript_59113/m.70515 type:complete len:290 (-) Transcript_59113:472-1341(-)
MAGISSSTSIALFGVVWSTTSFWSKRRFLCFFFFEDFVSLGVSSEGGPFLSCDFSTSFTLLLLSSELIFLSLSFDLGDFDSLTTVFTVSFTSSSVLMAGISSSTSLALLGVDLLTISFCSTRRFLFFFFFEDFVSLGVSSERGSCLTSVFFKSFTSLLQSLEFTFLLLSLELSFLSLSFDLGVFASLSTTVTVSFTSSSVTMAGISSSSFVALFDADWSATSLCSKRRFLFFVFFEVVFSSGVSSEISLDKTFSSLFLTGVVRESPPVSFFTFFFDGDDVNSSSFFASS